MRCARYQFVRIFERCECCLITPDGGKSRPELTKCQHRLSQHYKCKDAKKRRRKNRTCGAKGIQIETGNEWPHFPAANIAPISIRSGKRFPTSFHTKPYSYRRLAHISSRCHSASAKTNTKVCASVCCL